MNVFDGMTLNTTARLFDVRSTQSSRDLVYVNTHFFVNAREALPWSVADRSAHYHPRNIAYRAPAEHRAIAHLLTNPGLVVTGFGALALYGLPFLCDSADTVLTGPRVARKQFATLHSPGLTRSSPSEVWCVRYRGTRLLAVPPEIALFQALGLVKREEVAWPTVRVPGLTPEVVRAVQLLDSARHFLNIDPIKLLAASRGRLPLQWLADVLVASSALSESPKETEMRLLAHDIARKHRLRLVEQFVLNNTHGKPITRFDLALPDHKIGLMYDGAQHWEFERRNKDTEINLESAVLGWRVLRFSSGTLGGFVSTLDRILALDGEGSAGGL